MMIYPALFNMVIENGNKFDLTQFEKMMTTISKVRRKEVTEEAASQKFSEEMVEKYVKIKPKLD
jgi:hypothetical protein